jgi:hypothetical protein
VKSHNWERGQEVGLWEYRPAEAWVEILSMIYLGSSDGGWKRRLRCFLSYHHCCCGERRIKETE